MLARNGDFSVRYLAHFIYGWAASNYTESYREPQESLQQHEVLYIESLL